MLFNSITFLCFFALVLGANRLPFRWSTKKLHLLLASYLFYAAWNPPFVALLVLSTLVDWYVSRAIHRSQKARARRALLLVSLCVNLGMLGFFKYGGLALESFAELARGLGFQYEPAAWQIVLPVGISFYTFQTLSYTLDVYRGNMKPWGSFLDFALFVTFFPQLVAGPIVRASEFLPQCSRPLRATREQLGWGLSLMTVGLFQKVILADAILAPVANEVYAAVQRVSQLEAWVGTLAFSGQIFFDFAGYSTCAIGAAMCLGFALPDNFRYPYAAIGFSDFWRRWHISLSTWLRDYLYIPLGGNKRGAVRTQVNLALTMLLGGLWHGAAWRFVAWGALHGIYLALERVARKSIGARLPPGLLGHWPMGIALALLTNALVCITWVFFRAAEFDDAFVLLSSMLAGTSRTLGLNPTDVVLVLALYFGLLTYHWVMRSTSLEVVFDKLPIWVRGALLATFLLALSLDSGGDHAFIYFQF